MHACSCHACVQVLKTVHSLRQAPPLAQGEASGGGEREGDGPPASSGGVSGARDVPQPHKASRPKLVSCLCACMPAPVSACLRVPSPMSLLLPSLRERAEEAARGLGA